MEQALKSEIWVLVPILTYGTMYDIQQVTWIL